MFFNKKFKNKSIKNGYKSNPSNFYQGKTPIGVNLNQEMTCYFTFLLE